MRTKLQRPVRLQHLVSVLVACLLMSGAALFLSLRANEVSENRERAARQATQEGFCGILAVLDDSYSATPPTTPTGKTLAARISDYRAANCPPQALDAPLPTGTVEK